MQDIEGNDVSLSQFTGKVLLIVNVASMWYDLSLLFDSRFTPNIFIEECLYSNLFHGDGFFSIVIICVQNSRPT